MEIEIIRIQTSVINANSFKLELGNLLTVSGENESLILEYGVFIL